MGFNFKTVEIARSLRQETQAGLASKIKYYNQASLSKIESGQLNITLNRLEDFSKVLNMPVTFFLQRTFPQEEFNFHYMLTKKVDERKLMRARAEMKIMSSGVDNIFSNVPLRDITDAIQLANKSPKQIAQTIRQYLQVPAGMLDDATKFLMDSKIVIHRYDFGNAFIKGIGTKTHSGIWLIVLNSVSITDRKMQNEVLAYGLGNLLFNNSSILTGNQHFLAIEQFVHEYLLPYEYCKDLLRGLTFRKLEHLSHEWGLSTALIAKRAYASSIIESNTFKYLLTEIKRRKKIVSKNVVEGYNLERNLNNKIYSVKKSENLINEDLASMTNLYFDDFKHLFLNDY